LIQSAAADADMPMMVLFPPTPIQGDYTTPITLFMAGAAFLMHAAWCSYMGETDESYPSDSRVLPHIGRGSSNEPEDIGFDNKFQICVFVGGALIVCGAITFFFHR
jgi:hypothetical protein